MTAWRISRMGATLVVAVGLTTWLLPSTSAAASTCGFDSVTGTVTIDVGVSETATIARSGDAIDLNGAPCDAATVTNTGQVEVTTHEASSVVLDLGGGPFAPGTSTTDDDPEIKFDVAPSSFPSEYPFGLQILGTGGADFIAVGVGPPGMINLNADEPTPDQDVSFHGVVSLDLQGLDGNDDLWLGGGARVDPAALPAPIGIQLTLDAGPGDDWVGCGGGNGSLLAAGDGIDTLDCSALTGWVAINLDDGAGGTGRLLYSGGQALDLSRFENVLGTAFDDILYGDANDNQIVGGNGDDVLNGFGGKDHLVGKAGKDKVFGRGNEDVLFGGPGDDLLNGGGGIDHCQGGTGHDVIHACE